MDATFAVNFCSRGSFNPFKKHEDSEEDRSFVEFGRWSNQYGRGIELDFNFFWFQYSFNVYLSAKKNEITDG